MTNLIAFGIIATLLIIGGGTAALWWVSRKASAGPGKRRHRAEARILQARLDSDDDFTRNFHHPTQNEVLETLQALDRLTPAWERDGDSLTERRFKNELAESFPTLRRGNCVYPAPISEDLARLFGKAKPTPEALAARLHVHAKEMAQAREKFRTVIAQANAIHQISSDRDTGPLEFEPGSLPFRVADAPVVGQRSRRQKLAGAVALLACCAGAVLYAAASPGVRREVRSMVETTLQKGTVNIELTPRSIRENQADTSPKPAAAPVDQVPIPSEAAEGNQAPSAEPVTAASNPSPTPIAAASRPVPRAAAAAPQAPPEPTKATLQQLVNESKQRAIEKYPDLGVPNSEINLRFVFRYKNLLTTKSTRLQDPAWPEKLAEECAAAAVAPAPSKAKKLTQVNAAHH